ncbi:MAG: SOS response-associated peptidase [Chlorobium sp.]|jgi:putative SOS response-associated peptidase YedK|uniref:SOS response-associated peptidase n=1 Tax=Chlorobium sp. TaxID=1095 RepID=UPI001D9044F1|nr:SOS response-associated peptidase [Chlorobium sp.]MBN1278834.1 SOS response-associated peptidase [Chlorobiaceae bacterium]MCF8217167.1 SOS response-associated peptidase [Chlorobium sp.]MCF8272014.1 SOS response-associated peptidase [Chlorobium sp.]MCF8288385.1 SOS response-associated peptidase [Chlorobium sp.]MCF8291976.1 SOS response-associated peptidase [Chlorobium sp.]
MCGRFGFFELRYFVDRLRQLELPFEQDKEYRFMPGYNIAPESIITVLIGEEYANVLRNALWGLIPHWAQSLPKVRPINARSESLDSKPYFRYMLNHRHCLIPASGFYEWNGKSKNERSCKHEGKQAEKNKEPKQPFYIHRADGQPMAFAGLWDIWQPPDPEKKAVTSCTIITTEANADMLPVHERMPVIVEPKNWGLWLQADKGVALDLLKPAEKGVLDIYPVSARINNPQYIRKDCIVPLSGNG